MHALVTVAFMLGVATYSVAATLHFVNLLRRGGVSSATLWAPRVQLLAGLLHTGHLVIASFVTGTCPVASLPFALSLSGAVMALSHGLFGQRFGVVALGVAVAPLSLTFLVGAQFIGSGAADASLSPALLAVHITANLFGIALLLLAGAASGFYLFQERRLKTKKGRIVIGRLPPLDVLETAEHRLLLAGFPLLTLGVVTGTMFLRLVTEWTVSEVLRDALSYLSWVVVAAVLVLRSVAGWRGRRTAYGTLFGSVCVLAIIFAYIVRAGGGIAL
jgi:ABC-type uncharacterized transport system permease subunit